MGDTHIIPILSSMVISLIIFPVLLILANTTYADSRCCDDRTYTSEVCTQVSKGNCETKYEWDGSHYIPCMLQEDLFGSKTCNEHGSQKCKWLGNGETPSDCTVCNSAEPPSPQGGNPCYPTSSNIDQDSEQNNITLTIIPSIYTHHRTTAFLSGFYHVDKRPLKKVR